MARSLLVYRLFCRLPTPLASSGPLLSLSPTGAAGRLLSHTQSSGPEFDGGRSLGLLVWDYYLTLNYYLTLKSPRKLETEWLFAFNTRA